MFASYDRLGQGENNYAKANSPTLICPVTSESYGGSYRLKAGLITADELVLAGESTYVEGDSYLNIGTKGYSYYSMTPDVVDVGDASVWLEKDALFLDFVHNPYAIRPVINVTTNNGFASGSGTVSDPYVIAG